MSLSASVLANGLEALTSSFPASYAEAGQRWASAYGTYAASALASFGAAPVDVVGPQGLLASSLANAFQSGVPDGDVSSIAQAMAAAFTAFWLAPPQAFAGARTGLVTSVTGTSLLAAKLTSVMTDNAQAGVSAQDACKALADAIHTLAATIIVTSPAPPPPVIGSVS